MLNNNVIFILSKKINVIRRKRLKKFKKNTASKEAVLNK